MKTICLLMFAIICVTQANAQRIDSASLARLSPQQREEADVYLAKAKSSRVAGYTLLGVGAVVEIVAVVLIANDVSNMFDPNATDNEGLENALFIVGAAAMLGSIPCFINVHKKNNKVRAMLYGERRAWLAPNVSIPNSGTYGLRLVIPLGK